MSPRVARRRRSGEVSGTLDRYLGPNERVLLATRQHPFALVGAALDTGKFLLPLLIATWGIAGVELLRGDVGTWLLRLLFLVMIGFVLRLVAHVLAWEFERVVVTDEKVIHVAGVLNRRIASTPLAKVSEFTVRQPLLGRILGYGSLVVDVPGGRDQALHGLSFLPDPAGLYRLVSTQARRGRVEEGGGRLPQPPTDDDLARIDERARGFADVEEAVPPSVPHVEDPWQPRLDGALADHTIEIPRIPPSP